MFESKTQRIWLLVGLVAFTYGITSVAADSIRFDLARIGESIYEAHARSGQWPAQAGDLDGTVYLKMPYRKAALQKGVFKIVWHADLDPSPSANRNRILAYSNGGLLARTGFIWACYGDLRIVRIRPKDIPVNPRSTP